ncbi:hypothetical protein [Chromobacterium piscinae]|uniref:hypothetical protein n=1 Tax=Chromobacterium piscinae TaxID=686831 RepID=UPI003F81E60B
MKIVFIDEDPDQRDTFRQALESCFPKSIETPEVIAIAPAPTLAEMRFIIEDSNVVTVIIDEQLKDSGVAQYFGIELASYFRSANRKIPIYILTSYPESEELDDGEINVEDILSKQDLPKRREIVGARILRRINSYIDVIGDREKHFEDLLRKSISGVLNSDEESELKELTFLRESPYEVSEIIALDEIKSLEEIQSQIDEIKERLEKS